ncbi:hypothetical protein BRYFOR_05292 [Marvinbryantia formatexigens DSM 14469]|uniref:Uncharacterized protein n=1 Tax=Marvinbryantia formatexigens DSM 14469 TaxID=478749 RepID=C6L9K2_9FIRM|nr:hypothetical protein BRYFOR_05292 [Marvinbryantia formatexigens DSM 14469]
MHCDAAGAGDGIRGLHCGAAGAGNGIRKPSCDTAGEKEQGRMAGVR